MPAYKDNGSGKWYAQFYYTDWTGKRKRNLKEDFKPRKKLRNSRASSSVRQVLIWI